MGAGREWEPLPPRLSPGSGLAEPPLLHLPVLGWHCPQALQTAEPRSDRHCHPVIRSPGDSETGYTPIAHSLSLYRSEEIALIKSLLKIDKKMGQANPHLAGSPVRF